MKRERKESIRIEMKHVAAALPPVCKKAADEKIFLNVTKWKIYEESRTVFCYVGRGDEIDTVPILLDALKKGKRLAVPLCLGDGIMEAREISSLSDLKEGMLGIPEPGPDSRTVIPEEIDLCLVPCLAATKSGVRLGYGGGYYDRYLAGRHFVSAALCRERQVCSELPGEEHDIRMDAVITEREIICLKDI